MHPVYHILTNGDRCVTIQFDGNISPAVNALITNLAEILAKDPIAGIEELVPAYCSLSVHYEPTVLSYETLYLQLSQKIEKIKITQTQNKKTIFIPVCYGGDFGPDIEAVANHTGLSVEEIIRRHTEAEYLIYMLGFLPGFAYLGGLDTALTTPRRETPRTIIPAGSVGIGGDQTGIYPLASPGGWQLIGRTPVKPYDPEREPIFLYKPGDFIRFFAINEDEYHRIVKLTAENPYQCCVREGET